MNVITPYPGKSLMDLAIECDAVYNCPIVDSVRKGPLVVYAGKDKQGRNLVGDIYFNFRKIEAHPRVVQAFAEVALNRLHGQGLLNTFSTICGIPKGGQTFGQELARIASKKFAYAEKVRKPTEVGKKQEYSWDLSQFEFEEGERVAIAEDVFNNCDNTDQTLTEIAPTGANPVLLVGAFNRSPKYDKVYTVRKGFFEGKILPIVTSIREAYPEYEQDDPYVATDVAAGNIEFEVKKNWAHLRALMEKYGEKK